MYSRMDLQAESLPSTLARMAKPLDRQDRAASNGLDLTPDHAALITRLDYTHYVLCLARSFIVLNCVGCLLLPLF